MTSDHLPEPADEPVSALEAVAHFTGAMPTGVTVSHQGRVFVNFPKWGDDVRFTVAELRDGQPAAYLNDVRFDLRRAGAVDAL
jgi:hypothetical protein